jgi:hypothetical protein
MRPLAYVLLSIPVLLVVAGLYILLATPDVITVYETFTSSHGYGLLLILIGAIGLLLAGLVASA